MPFDPNLDRKAFSDVSGIAVMSHRGRSRSLDYPKIAKFGFLAGLALFVAGVAGEVAGHSFASPMPAAAETALLTMETVGVAVAFVVPIVFGAVLPLVE